MFIIEGNIGAGKSTFLRLIEENVSEVAVVQEPVDSWQDSIHGQSLLTNFYVEPTRWAYTFELLTLMSRLKENTKHVYNPGIVTVIERSIYSGYYCFAKNSYEQGFLADVEWEMYKEWFSFLVSQLESRPKGFIYLRISPEVAYERIKKRNRYAEKTVSLGYLKQIHNRHEEFLIEKSGLLPSLKDVPVLVLDCEQEFETDKHKLAEHIEKVKDFCFNIARQGLAKNAISIVNGQAVHKNMNL